MRVRREAVKIEPSNKDARTKLSECEKAIKKERFEAAIGMDAPGSTQIDPDTIDVEASYNGPVLEEGQVTAQFVDELTEGLKQASCTKSLLIRSCIRFATSSRRRSRLLTCRSPRASTSPSAGTCTGSITT